MINFKKSRTTIEIASLDKSNLHGHMTHVVQTDILSGHEEIDNLHFILKIIFQYMLSEDDGIQKKLHKTIKP